MVADLVLAKAIKDISVSESLPISPVFSAAFLTSEMELVGGASTERPI